MMKVLILGGTGMLGHKLYQVLSPDFETWTTIRRPFDDVRRFGIFDKDRVIDVLDVADETALKDTIENIGPQVVVNAVGIIKQLDAPKELNWILPKNLANWSRDFGYRVISISTDCVFSGNRGNYSEADIPDAGDVYGRSKVRGEVRDENCLTIRTSIIGRELDTSHSLVEWFLGNRGGTVNGFTKVIYTGFTTAVLARIISDIITNHPSMSSLYHVSSDPISKFDLLDLINQHYNAGIDIIPSDQMANDRSLDSTRFRLETGFVPPTWDEMVQQMAADPTLYESFHSEG